MGLLNEIENLYDKYIKLNEDITSPFMKELQILKIKSSMVTIKSGDTDGESYSLSKEVFENNNKFFESYYCSLSRADQELQKISEHDRNYVWYCCQYNFAHQLAYNKIAPPGVIKIRQNFIQ
ncbi:MAG: hypothetical protein AB8W37_06855 [Arsenophonus endosymbiont of Dermacentor nuttalli]